MELLNSPWCIGGLVFVAAVMFLLAVIGKPKKDLAPTEGRVPGLVLEEDPSRESEEDERVDFLSADSSEEGEE